MPHPAFCPFPWSGPAEHLSSPTLPSSRGFSSKVPPLLRWLLPFCPLQAAPLPRGAHLGDLLGVHFPPILRHLHYAPPVSRTFCPQCSGSIYTLRPWAVPTLLSGSSEPRAHAQPPRIKPLCPNVAHHGPGPSLSLTAPVSFPSCLLLSKAATGLSSTQTGQTPVLLKTVYQT